MPLRQHVRRGDSPGEAARADDLQGRVLVYPGDFADFKLGAEVMLRGTCHPRRAVPECEVAFAVGDRTWKLNVSGPRVWRWIAVRVKVERPQRSEDERP